MKPPAALTLLALFALATPAIAERTLFAMDTGTRDGQTKTYAQQAALVKELGFSGIGFGGSSKIPEMLAAVDTQGIKNLGVTFNLCHWLKVDGKELEARLKEALPHLFVVTINGADSDGKGWNTLIQPLDRGTFDVAQVLRLLDKLEFKGPIGLQHYGIRGSARGNLSASMKGWKALQARLAAEQEKK